MNWARRIWARGIWARGIWASSVWVALVAMFWFGSAVAGPERFVSAWMPYWNDSAAAGSVLEHAAQIATASPFWYSISTAGAVSAEPGAGPASVVAALRARGVEVVPTVTEAAGLDAFDRMLANGERRAALVRSLVALAREDGYAGIDLDFEQFAVDPQDDTVAAAAATRAFSGFVAALCAALHAVDRSCTVTVMPRTSAAQTLWRRRLATWVFDYRALGRVADTVRIMAYDEHGRHGPAGPVAPLPWVEQVIAYARSQIPAAKVELGLAAFGWLWGPHGVEAFSAAQGPAVAAAAGTTATWSASADEMSFTAGTGAGRVVGWYEDTRADAIRAKLAAAAGFRGVALWAAGDETPDFWAAMRAVPGS